MARRSALALLAAAAIAAGCGGDGATTTSSPPRSSQAPTGVRGLTVVRRERLDARLEEWTLRSSALRDPTHVRVLLPAGYRTAPRRRYPVLYLLHGAGSTYRSWTGDGDAEAITARAPMIVVMPDGGAEGWYTDWYEGKKAVQPRWETYHVGQLIPWVDATYRTVAARRGRAVAGLSMGGFGALSYAARHPGTFVAAASYSGALEVGSDEAWGPQSENAERWRAHLPVSIAARLRSLELIELRTGDGRPGPLDPRDTSPGCDRCSLERYLYESNARLHRRLQELGIRHVWDDYGPGTHVWPYWRRALGETLPNLERTFARK